MIDGHGRNLGDFKALPAWVTASMLSCRGYCSIQHMATYVRRDFFHELGGFDIAYRVAGDYDFFCRALAREPYGRIPHLLACNRETGSNFGVVHRQAGQREWRAVREVHGPQSHLRRWLNKHFMKALIYGSNPGWTARGPLRNRRIRAWQAAVGKRHAG
jgi:hypothetical protein